jgi:hypothetical protein
MVACRNAPDGLDERGPRLSLLCEHAPAFGCDFVEAAAPLAGLLDPAALDPSTLLEAVEQRVKRIDVERQLAAGSRVDQLAQFVAVTGPRVEQRENQQLRRSFLQLAVERAGVDICHRQTVYKQTFARQPGFAPPCHDSAFPSACATIDRLMERR